jgi:hypothetical protein
MISINEICCPEDMVICTKFKRYYVFMRKLGKVGNRVSGQRLLGNMFHFSTTNHMMSGKKIWTMRKLNM